MPTPMWQQMPRWNDIAKALDAGYTNNELFTSLNVGTTAELNSALKQVSGSQATTVFRERAC
ncbi:autotransporter beta-domain-containing protein [Escherichia coli]|uniref:Autotransporter beta-domain-containing protein n=1 Tax=Escherichia coli TaxID=562 RepID=A0A376YAM4_ECOLX|nr:autotransporter beta-domain-containing protein [Escherichia coli]